MTKAKDLAKHQFEYNFFVFASHGCQLDVTMATGDVSVSVPAPFPAAWLFVCPSALSPLLPVPG